MREDKWDDNFFSKREHIAWRAKPVCDQIIKQFNPQSVVDVGCGIGEFLKYFNDLGIQCTGIESTEAVFPYAMVGRDIIEIQDITKYNYYPVSRFDVALCFMVVGRLPEAKWGIVSKYLSRISNTIITVVEENKKWSAIMERNKFHENIDASTTFKNALSPLFDKTAVRSFQFTQVFRKGR